ncbi:unnamed protein product, partial [Choristocarpus tenellus]
QESYPYYRLPYCLPNPSSGEVVNKKKRAGLGEILAGNKLRSSGFDIKYKVSQPKTELCTADLQGDSVEMFKQAVRSTMP